MIPAGHMGECRTMVTADLGVEFRGPQSAHVLGTPFLIALLERTARQSIQRFLADGEDSVGVSVDIRHLAPVPVARA
jgi:predicted thioesterase